MDFDEQQDNQKKLCNTAERLLRMRNEALLVLQKARIGYEKEISRLEKNSHVPPKKQTELNEAFSCITILMNHISWHCKKYHQSFPEDRLSATDKLHCIRFHPFS